MENPYNNFNDESLVNLYRLLWNQNSKNKEWFRTHNPLTGEPDIHDVNTRNYIQCMQAIEDRLDPDVKEAVKNNDMGRHEAMMEWIKEREYELNREIVNLDYCVNFGYLEDYRGTSIDPYTATDEQLVRVRTGAKPMPLTEWRKQYDRDRKKANG